MTERQVARLCASALLIVLAACFLEAPYLVRWETYAVGGGFLILGAALCLISGGVRVRDRVVLLAFLVALVAVGRALTWGVEPRIQHLGVRPFAFVSALLLTPFVEAAEASSGAVFVDLGNGGRQFLASPSLTGAAVFLLTWTVLVALRACLRPAGLFAYGATLGLFLIAIAVLRFCVLCVAYQQMEATVSGDHHIALAVFWNPWSLVASLGLVWVFAARWSVSAEPEDSYRGLGKPSLLVLACVGLLTIGTLYRSSGSSTEGRVLVDDRLSGLWEPAGRLLTPDRFGDFSTYSFASFTEHLGRHYPVTVNPDRLYTPELLADYDVLILKTPHKALSDEEVEVIQAWVLEGGGLFAIGDHTDLGGMNTTLNRVTTPFGIRFRNDSLNAASGRDFLKWRGGLLSEHPISKGMGPFGFMTGCSLQLSGSARPVMTHWRGISQRGDYGNSSNFGAAFPEPGDAQGTLIACGRVRGRRRAHRRLWRLHGPVVVLLLLGLARRLLPADRDLVVDPVGVPGARVDRDRGRAPLRGPRASRVSARARHVTTLVGAGLHARCDPGVGVPRDPPLRRDRDPRPVRTRGGGARRRLRGRGRARPDPAGPRESIRGGASKHGYPVYSADAPGSGAANYPARAC